MPSYAINPFRRAQGAETKPSPSPTTTLARAMLSEAGPTRGELRNYRSLVAWRENPEDADYKVNYHGYQLLKREMKRLNGGDTIAGLPHDRLERYFAVPTRMKIEHAAAKHALKERQGLHEMVRSLKAQLTEAEKTRDEGIARAEHQRDLLRMRGEEGIARAEAERDALRARGEHLRRSLYEFITGSDDVAPLHQPRSPKVSMRSTGAARHRPLSGRFDSPPLPPLEALSSELVGSALPVDDDLLEASLDAS